MKQLLLLIIMLCATLFAQAYTREIEKFPDELIVTYTFNTPSIIRNESINKIQFHMKDFGTMFEDGKPELPSKTETFEIPEGCQIKGHSISAITDTIQGECTISQSLSFDNEQSETATKTTTILPFEGLWPISNASISSGSSYKGLNVGFITLTPLQYDFNAKHTIFAKQIILSIKFESTTTPSHSNTSYQNLTLEEFDELIDIPFTEPGFPSNTSKIATETRTFISAPKYLIICPTTFKPAAQKLANWKRRLGYNVTIQDRDSIFLSSPQNIYSIIKQEYTYNSGSENTNNLEYVLLLGGGFHITPWQGKFKAENKKYYTDFYFACLDGDNDYIPDVTIGRLPAHNLDEANTMVDKTIQYEKNPPLSSSTYFNSGIHISKFYPKQSPAVTPGVSNTYPGITSDIIAQDDLSIYNPDIYEDRHFVKTSESILNYLSTYNIIREYYASENANPKMYSDVFSDGEAMPTYLHKPTFAWNASAQSIANSINNGSSYILYRGHGQINSWAEELFSNSNIGSLSNYTQLPVIFNITCLNGVFRKDGSSHGVYDNDCYSMSEMFLNHKTGGAVGIIAANQVSYSGYNDYFASLLFDEMHPDPGLRISLKNLQPCYDCNPYDCMRKPTLHIGKLMNVGMKHLFEIMGHRWGSTTSTELRYSQEIYHCLADPSIKVYTKKPINKNPLFTRINNKIVLRDNRTLVLVNKTTKEVFTRNNANGFIVDDYISDFDISLIGDDYVPILYNQGIIPRTNNSSNISFSTTNSTITLDCTNQDGEITAHCTDIQGNVYSSKSCNNGIITLQRPNTTCIISVEKDGEIILTHTIN